MRFLLLMISFSVATVVGCNAQQRLPPASSDLVNGIEAYNRGDFATAVTHLQTAAGRGEPEAMVNLGYIYARGDGVSADPAFALELYRRAAEAGDAEGMNAVGYR